MLPNVHIPPSVFTIAGQKLGSDTLFGNEALAVDSGAEWFGPGAPVACATCCEVRANLTILLAAVWAVRNDRCKLVKSDYAPCDASLNPCQFYEDRLLLHSETLDLSDIATDLSSCRSAVTQRRFRAEARRRCAWNAKESCTRRVSRRWRTRGSRPRGTPKW